MGEYACRVLKFSASRAEMRSIACSNAVDWVSAAAQTIPARVSIRIR